MSINPRASSRLSPRESARIGAQLDALGDQPNLFSPYADNIRSQPALPGMKSVAHHSKYDVPPAAHVDTETPSLF